MAITFGKVKNKYTELLGTMEVRPEWKDRIEKAALRIAVNRDRYEEVSKSTNVPWEVIAAIHNLEGSCNFNTHLHNGDSLQRKTVHVPKGRPDGTPPFTWEESAEDALTFDGLNEVDWSSDEAMCFALEKYNGLGYLQSHPKVLSPYLWSGTNHYTKGKYVEDGTWSSSEVSQQIGAIPLIMKLREQKKEVRVADITPYSKKLSVIGKIRGFMGAVWASIAGLFTMENFDNTKRILEPFKQFVWDYKLWLAGSTCAALWLVFKYLEWSTVQDFKEGRYTPSKMDE